MNRVKSDELASIKVGLASVSNQRLTVRKV